MFEFSNGGSRFRQIREPLVKDGKISVEVVGKEDLQDYINSFADSVDVDLIVARAVNGDPDALNQRQAMYGDFTQFPKTYAEMLDKMIQGQTLFESLPLDVRNRFDNNVYTFLSQMDEPDWLEKAGFVQPKVNEEGEVKE